MHFAATGGDIELNRRDGVAFVVFERKAATLARGHNAAIQKSIRRRRRAVVRVESEAANVITKINAISAIGGGMSSASHPCSLLRHCRALPHVQHERRGALLALFFD